MAPYVTKINYFNGVWQQADRIRVSGRGDVEVMNMAIKDFQSKYPSGFHHVKAWEVVSKHDKWAPVPLLGEDSGSSGQKRKSSDSGNYNASTPGTEFTSDIPDINVDPSPTRPRKKDKRPATSPTDSKTPLTKKLAQYTRKKKKSTGDRVVECKKET
ncbi:hypothetical protein HanIR_Chr16g0834671 [Helianthus annuus]|nr:hypothetical protein HanIR_Chr16g0834671 [Helianthus annuus]